jgi:1-acyl-sn-glycerol-3-phosphate acyltransferase
VKPAADALWPPAALAVLRRPGPPLPFGYRWLLRCLLWLFAPLAQVDHPDRLQEPGPVLFAFTHSTFFETLFAVLTLYHLRRERVGFMVDWMYGHWPVLGRLIRQVDPVWVWNKTSQFGWINRRKGARPGAGAWAEGLERLAQGRSLALFPEGRARRDPHRLQPGRRGAGRLALAAGVPVVPVGIDFPLRLQRGRVPRFGRLIFRVGRPLRFASLAQAYRETQDPLTRARLAAAATEAVMLELARLARRAPAQAAGTPLASC